MPMSWLGRRSSKEKCLHPGPHAYWLCDLAKVTMPAGLGFLTCSVGIKSPALQGEAVRNNEQKRQALRTQGGAYQQGALWGSQEQHALCSSWGPRRVTHAEPGCGPFSLI